MAQVNVISTLIILQGFFFLYAETTTSLTITPSPTSTVSMDTGGATATTPIGGGTTTTAADGGTTTTAADGGTTTTAADGGTTTTAADGGTTTTAADGGVTTTTADGGTATTTVGAGTTTTASGGRATTTSADGGATTTAVGGGVTTTAAGGGATTTATATTTRGGGGGVSATSTQLTASSSSVVVHTQPGPTEPPPVGSVTCNADHTVDITISNVFDVDQWTAAEWQLEDSAACKPTLDNITNTVTYSGLVLPDCARKDLVVDNNVTIKYVLEISVKKTSGSSPGGQMRSYNHQYFVSCEYDSQNTSVASFVPVVSKYANDTGFSFFTFQLDVFADPDFLTAPTNPVALDEPLYLWARVVTQSNSPNLDLFPVSCWVSSSWDENSARNKVILISDGCGDAIVSQDFQDTLDYACTDNSVNETFEIRTFRFFGFDESSTVYFHCDLRVCLADFPASACECPADRNNCAKRKRRSAGEYVVEFHVRAGPYIFAEEVKEEQDDDEVESKEQDKSKEQDESEEQSQSFSTNLAIIVSVSCVALAICATVCFVVRSRNKRRLHGDLSMAT